MQAATRFVLGLGLLTSVSSVLAGCGRDKPATSSTQPAAAPPSAPATTPQAPATAQGGDTVSGTVLETMRSGGYTYAKIDRGGTPVWVAGPETELAVGAKIENATGMLMRDFHSNTLDRTFDQIYFLTSFGGPPAAGPHAGAAAANPHAGGAPAAPAPTGEKVAPAPGGTTIADVFANKAKLAGKPVVVRGKVVKVNEGIMGRNWLHLQDGTGGAGTNDLVVTTSAAAVKGDVVTARGTLATNKDFGGGYSYDVIVEDATLTAK